MSNAYEAWRRTKDLLAGDHSEERELSAETIGYLDMAEEALRPAALLGYLDTNCRRFDSERYDPEDRATDADVREFLSGLDELRAPNQREIEQLRAEIFNPAIGQVERLRKMNWTGDHTYGDALDDVREVLLAVWERKPFPVLERFRCPSIRKGSPAGWRCELQLPHDGPHKVTDPLETWTDEQSVNPPKNYDEPAEICGQRFCSGEYEETCTLSEGHDLPHIGTKITWTSANSWNPIITDQQLDKIADEVFGNPDPINRSTAEDTDGQCGAENPSTSGMPGGTCVRPKKHKGPHRDAAGMRWNR